MEGNGKQEGDDNSERAPRFGFLLLLLSRGRKNVAGGGKVGVLASTKSQKSWTTAFFRMQWTNAHGLLTLGKTGGGEGVQTGKIPPLSQKFPPQPPMGRGGGCRLFFCLRRTYRPVVYESLFWGRDHE